MAHSTLTLYATKITPDKNALVENLSDYLATCISATISDVQYFKHALETTVKLDLNGSPFFTQAVIDNFTLFNYIKIQNTDNNYRAFYYFIMNTKWIAEKTIQLTLYLDTINTFQTSIVGHFTEKTQIHRQHKDRFVKKASAISESNKYLMPIVDKAPEGLSNVPLLKESGGNALPQNHRWVLMYIQDYKESASTLTNATYIYALPRDTSMIATNPLTTLLSANAIDTTENSIIKLIELPYEPFGVSSIDGLLPSIPSGWEIANVTENVTGGGGHGTPGFQVTGKVLRKSAGYLSIGDLVFETYIGYTTLPHMLISLGDTSNLGIRAKNAYYEPKLFNSDFYSYKYIYDSYSKPIRYEDVSYTTAGPTDSYDPLGFGINFYPSSDISSKLMFKFIPLTTTAYKNIADYEEFLVSGRNNEPLRINSNFVNYIRNGYNFDKKAHDIQTTSNIINFGVDQAKNAFNIVNYGTQGNAGGLVNTFGSMIKSTNNAITQELLYENSMQQKLSTLAAQAAQVTGADDLSLLEIYNGNKLLYAEYKPTQRMQEVLFDKFYYTGYADEHLGVPDINSRRIFNFIQCDPVFDTESDVSFYKYLKDVKERFAAGVTVFHKFNTNQWNLTDINYENWETWICAR